MAVDNSTFETINPSAFTTFTFPNPSPSAATSLLRVAVLDSPLQPAADPPRVAAMLVPKHRHSDWIFSTLSGHLQLLSSSPAFSRLILVGDSSPHSPPIYRRPLKDDDEELGVSLQPLFLALSPKSCFKHGIPEVPILRYQDNLISSVVLEICDGPFVGEMVVEDVEIDCGGEASKREFRRRLRFKRMPNLVQTEVRIVPKIGFGLDCVGIGQVEFRLDDSVLVHSYLVPMVASLSLAAPYIEGRIRSGVRPKALCLGVGGGALLGFLRTQLGFQVEGVEADEEVLRVSRQYFGLEDGEHINVRVGDALEVIDKLAGACQVEEGCDVGSGNDVDTKFDVIMVDLDSSDARDGLIAPPLDFVRKPVLLSARSILSDHGILAVNVIPPNTSFYKTLIHTFEDVFNELYEIDVGNGENFVLVAVASPLMPPSDRENFFLNRLGKAISGAYLNSIRKI